jgi:Family of unknown function (DUF5677)
MEQENFESMNKLENFLKEVEINFPASVLLTPDSNFEIVMMILLLGAFKISKAILLLCRNGFDIEAGSLLRTLFYNGIYVEYISKIDAEREERASYLIDQFATEISTLNTEWQKVDTGLMLVDVETLNKIREHITKMKQLGSRSPNNNPIKKSLYDMAIEVGWEKEYKTLFPLLSDFAKVGTFSLYNGMQESNGRFGFKIKPTFTFSDMICNFGFYFFEHIHRRIYELLEINRRIIKSEDNPNIG